MGTLWWWLVNPDICVGGLPALRSVVVGAVVGDVVVTIVVVVVVVVVQCCRCCYSAQCLAVTTHGHVDGILAPVNARASTRRWGVCLGAYVLGAVLVVGVFSGRIVGAYFLCAFCARGDANIET